MTAIPTYQTQFPDYAAADMPDMPASWVDQSWHNDMCPSFVPCAGLSVWVDYANPDMRQIPEGPRFVVIYTDVDGAYTGDALATDDWGAVREFVSKHAGV